MFKAILATASAALLAVSFGASAHAAWNNGISLNGISYNGWSNGLSANGWANGLSSNGWNNGLSTNGWTNGLSANGTMNGLSSNGVSETGYVPQRAPSVVIDDIELPVHDR